MVDLHTHILPGVDDGADNFHEAMEMLDIAASNGTTHIVLTPHYLTREHIFAPLKKNDILSRFETFKEAAAQQYPGIKLYSGAELFAVNNIIDVIEDDQIIPINGTKYVLTEFGFEDRLSRATDVATMLTGHGYVPVLAHPERYNFIQRNPRDIVRFLEMGCLIQINTTSLSGFSGRLAQDVALSFLENNLVTAVASDSHSMYHRVPNLSEAYAFVSSNFSDTYAEDIFYNNPLAIINGTPVY